MNTKVQVIIPGNLPAPLWYEVNSDTKLTRIQPGSLVEVPLHSKTVTGLVILLESKELPFKTKKISRNLDIPPFSGKWVEMLLWMASYYHASSSKVLNSCLPKSVISILQPPKKKLKPWAPEPSEPEHSHEKKLILTPEQQNAVNSITSWISGNHSNEFNSFLLHGVTGSGKTLVYLHLIEACLAKGKNVLVLLPEIALTPQMMDVFTNYLDIPVYPMHSNLSTPQKRSLWKAMISRRAAVVVGVRSAVLCPMENLGLIIVDEEHDSSYKQSDVSPRYNARDVAVFRARQNNCPVVLGSATPSLESYYLAQKEKYYLINVVNRATSSPPPVIEIVDMNEQYKLQGDHPLSIPLRDALTESLRNKEQAILLLNRRGFSKKRICSGCGSVKKCPDCMTILIHHKTRGKLSCRSCSYSENNTHPCRECGEKQFIDTGLAIEKLEECLQKLYPDHKTLRLDSDSTGRKGMVKKIIDEFASGRAGILLGTQMVAKGHDFPGVNLVGVIDADTGLGVPDFRSQERIFQLLTQVSGRAGRHSNRGRVFIQTYQSDNSTFKYAFNQNYKDFFNGEMKLRKELNYPPYSRMIKLEISSNTESLTNLEMEKFSRILSNFTEKTDISLIGPGPAVQKRRNIYNSMIFGKGKSSNQLQWAFSRAEEQFLPIKKSSTRVQLDVDPVAMI